MPDRESYPSPEDLEVEIDTLLASLVDIGVVVDVLIIDVLLQRVREQACKG